VVVVMAQRYPFHDEVAVKFRNLAYQAIID
jgi:hypothetical protein